MMYRVSRSLGKFPKDVAENMTMWEIWEYCLAESLDNEEEAEALKK